MKSKAMNIKKKKNNQKDTQVSLVRRALAFMIDWYIGSVLISLPALAILQQVNNDKNPVLEMRSLPFNFAIVAMLSSLIVAVLYYVVVTYIFGGQTLGKKCLKIKICEYGKDKVGILTLLKRQLLGIILIEGSLYTITPLIWQVVFYGNASYQQMLTWGYYAVTILSVLMLVFGKSKRMLHDYVGNTYVTAK